MASSTMAPVGANAAGIRQSTRQTRTNPSRLSKTAAAGRSSLLSHATGGGSSGGPGSSGLASMLNPRQRLSNNVPQGIYPGITHFTDTIAAIPREFRRHESLLKEVDGKSWALEERLPVVVSAAAERVMVPAKNGERPGEETIHPSKTAGMQTEHAEITARRQLFQHIRNTLSDLLPTMDEKNHVARNANKELKKQIQRLDTAYSHAKSEVSDEVRLGSLTHWAYSNKTIGKPSGTGTERPRRETAGGRERNVVDDTGRDGRKHRRTQVDADAEDGRPARKIYTSGRGKTEVHDTVPPASGTPGAPAKRRRIEKPQPILGSTAMERTASTNTTSGRGGTKDTNALDKRKSRTRDTTTTTQRKRTNTITSTAGSPGLASPLVPPISISGKAASPAPSGPNRQQSSRAQQAAQSISNGRQRPSSSASNRAPKKSIPDEQPGSRSGLISTGSNVNNKHGSPLLSSRSFDSNLKREEAIGHPASISRSDAIQAAEVAPSTQSKGRSKTSTPAVATFAEAQQQSQRARPLRSADGGTTTKRSHKRGAGSISRQQALAAAEDEDSSRQGDDEDDEREPRYCYCNQISFGEMVACDMENCPREWFHLSCVGMTRPPLKSVKWYCNRCKETMKKSKSGGK